MHRCALKSNHPTNNKTTTQIYTHAMEGGGSELANLRKDFLASSWPIALIDGSSHLASADSQNQQLQSDEFGPSKVRTLLIVEKQA